MVDRRLRVASPPPPEVLGDRSMAQAGYRTMSEYKYDVFVSYSHEEAVKDWVELHFHRALNYHLGANLPREPKIFRDRSAIEPGEPWREELRDGLIYSRCLVAIWSPRYRFSKWCQIEWESMMCRQELLRKQGHDANIVLPIIYSDGHHFLDQQKRAQFRNFRDYQYPYPNFEGSSRHEQFNDAMVKLGELLARWIDCAPPWSPDWPIVDNPDIPPLPGVTLRG